MTGAGDGGGRGGGGGGGGGGKQSVKGAACIKAEGSI